MDDYYEELWERLPDDLKPPDLRLRRDFLLGARISAGERALDLGCGTGAFTALLASAGADVIGADVAEAALARARSTHPGLSFSLVPIDGPLPFEDSAFSLVWASEVVEHVADTARWLSEVRRVLAPGGRLLLTTPAHGRLGVALRGVEHYSQPLGDHLHLYTRRSLRELLTDFGFSDIDVRTAAGVPPLRRLLLARAVR
ncbi:MAG TPA: class I SAM-dependent methyltransferase [Solirubrobacteraceae bacterium]|nr:class I SAM-dependent methyltransferase [Solirubrobacteraceae bacterium]